MKVGICGLGLIGGSMAKAYSEGGHEVLGFDTNSASLGYAMLSGIISSELNSDTIQECDLIFIALYPLVGIIVIALIIIKPNIKLIVLRL